VEVRQPDRRPGEGVIRERVGILGPGGVGGALAVHLAQAGFVVVVVTHHAAAVYDRGVLTLEWQGRELTAEPYGTTLLDGPVDLLLVTVKAPALEDALGRVQPQAVERAVILPLMNGLEHVDTIRARLPGRVAAGSIGRFEAFKTAPTCVVQTSGTPLVTLASEELPRAEVERAASLLERAGVETKIEQSERVVLWDKAARLAPMAALTSLTGKTVGEVRTELRPQLEAGVAEACAVATADGAPTDPERQLAIVDSIPGTVRTSTSRDIAAGSPSELDAIVGGVVRAGRRVGVPTPILEELLEQCRAS
jgi:2-dehydropantoate 2-reductase